MAFKNDQVSYEETEKILELAKKSLASPGDFVELGCYKGDTSLLLAEVLKDTDHILYIYDSFEGLPPRVQQDGSAAGTEFTCKEITEQTIPVDFAGKKPHKVWEFTLK